MPPTRHRENTGFTVIELLVVILIVGISAAIAIPALYKQPQVTAAQTAATRETLTRAAAAERAYHHQHGLYTALLTELPATPAGVTAQTSPGWATIELTSTYTTSYGTVTYHLTLTPATTSHTCTTRGHATTTACNHGHWQPPTPPTATAPADGRGVSAQIWEQLWKRAQTTHTPLPATASAPNVWWADAPSRLPPKR